MMEKGMEKRIQHICIDEEISYKEVQRKYLRSKKLCKALEQPIDERVVNFFDELGYEIEISLKKKKG